MNRLSVRAAQIPTDEGTAWRAMVAEFCCDEMAEAWEDGVVGFGAKDEPTDEPAVNLYRVDVWPEATVWTEYAIRFCPFCGVEIDLQSAEATPG